MVIPFHFDGNHMCYFESILLLFVFIGHFIDFIYIFKQTASGKHPAVRSFGENTFAMENKNKIVSGRIIIIPVNNTFYTLL
jgi:hypothetical protein